MQALKKIDGFRKLSDEDLHYLIYGLEHVNYEKGSMLWEEGDCAESLILIKSGTVVLTKEINKKVKTSMTTLDIQQLGGGSILNSSTFLYKDTLEVGCKCLDSVVALEISHEKF
jgi:signal-transduction protein with cAMP-binding, CBS, and nucleotidyltransferase domain